MGQAMMTSLIWGECSAAETMDMRWSLDYGHRVMGGMCSKRDVGTKMYNPNCALDAAKACLWLTPLDEIVKRTPTGHSEELCR